MPKLRAVEAGETANKSRKLTVTQAAQQGDHRQMLVALRARIARTVEAPNCNTVALAALTRQMVLLSKELSVLDADDCGEDVVAVAARTADEPWEAI
jgi:hypothetical protein